MDFITATVTATGPPVTVAASRPSSAMRWAVTAVATVVSACALDATATIAGVVLAATNVLTGAPSGVLLGLLAGTYVVWGAALDVNLLANWRLLQATGTSTNLLSKALYDRASMRSSRRRARLARSAVGHVATEVAKEAPHYSAAAFGSDLAVDGVDGADAIVFLSGRNVGAAACDCSAGRLTRLYRARRSRRESLVVAACPIGDLPCVPD